MQKEFKGFKYGLIVKIKKEHQIDLQEELHIYSFQKIVDFFECFFNFMQNNFDELKYFYKYCCLISFIILINQY